MPIQYARVEEQAPAVDSQANDLLPSERVMAAGYLPRILTTTDLSMILIAVILFIANAAVVPGAGAAAFLYWGLGFVSFLIPCAIVVADLGLVFPGEGSIYLWTTKTLGAFWGFFAGFCHWFPGVLVMVATSDVVMTIFQSIGPTRKDGSPAWLVEPWQQGLMIVGVLIFSFLLAILPLRVVQTLVNSVVSAYLVAILLVGAAGLFWLLSGHLPQQDFSPGSWHLGQSNWGYYGTVILALLGVELPLTLGAEIRHRASITRHLVWGTVGIMLAYLIGTFGVMMVIPASQNGNPAAVTGAVSRAFGSFWGLLVSLVIALFFLFNTALYNYLFARMLMVTSLDRRLPAKLAHLNSSRQPAIAMLCQTVIAAIFTVIAFGVVPYGIKIGHPGELSSEVYSVFQAATTVVWCIAMCLLFVAASVARRKLRAQGRLGDAQTPSAVIGVCAVVGVLASLAGIWTTLTGSWVPSLIPNDRWMYIVIVACFAGLDVGLLLTFFLTGRPSIEPSRAREQRQERSAVSNRSLPAIIASSSADLSSQPMYPQPYPAPQSSYPPPQMMYPSQQRRRDSPS